MNFTLTEEQQRFREEVRDFCQKTPHGEIDDRIAGGFSPEFYRKVATKRWLGLTFPEEYGGQGRSMIEATILVEEMALCEAPVALPPYGSTGYFLANILLQGGSEQQKRYYLPRIARGEMWLGQGFTESCGSDLLATATRAVRQDDHYIINGEKIFNTWAHRGPYLREHGISQHVILLARTDQSAPPDKSLSLFIFDVTESVPGMSIYPIITPYDRTNGVFFDDVRISAESLLGEENHAWDYLVGSGSFYWNRAIGFHVGIMGGLFQELVQYVKETKVDGKSLSKNVLIRHKLAELAIQIEEVRLLNYQFAWAFDKGLDLTGLGAALKFKTDRSLLYLANAAMQILGSYGELEKETEYAPLSGIIEPMYKNLMSQTFACTGPSAMINVIAGYVLGLPNEFGLIY